MIPALTIRQLKYFAAIYESGSISKAAERLWRYGLAGSQYLSKPFRKQAKIFLAACQRGEFPLHVNLRKRTV